MSCRLEGVLVCLHDVELWAECATNHVGITVVEAIGLVWLPIPVKGWCLNEIERADTVAANLAHVHIVLNCSTEEPWLIVVIWVKSWLFAEECTTVHWDPQVVSSLSLEVAWSCDVDSLVLAIFLDSQRCPSTGLVLVDVWNWACSG